MTDTELRDAAVQALKMTTVSYPTWKKKVEQGTYPDVTKTRWWQAFNYLEQIGAPPPAPTGGVLGWGQAEQDLARAGWQPTRVFTVTTAADFQVKWNGLQAGDRLVCSGFSLSGYNGWTKRLAGRAEVIGLKFTGGGARGTFALDCELTNVHLYDVEITNANGRGWRITDSVDASIWGRTYGCPSGGGGHWSNVLESRRVDLRGLIEDCGDPAYDDAHPENPGTGIHGFYLAGGQQWTSDGVFSFDVRDQHTGAAISTGHHIRRATIYVSGIRCTWPAVSSVAGNTLQFWGGLTQEIRIPYVYGEDNAGRVIEAEPNSNDTNPAGTVKVEHGRGVRCLKALYPGAPHADRYFMPRAMFDYQDINPL
jgi:hypothetical protein